MPDINSVEGIVDSLRDRDCRKVMVIGATDTGKTFLALALAERLGAEGLRVGVLDFDLGQSCVGPPGVVGLQLPWGGEGSDPLFPTAMVFLGYLSPAWDIGGLVRAGVKLEELAFRLGCDVLIMDTSGMVEGNLAALLKRLKIRKLRPDLILALDWAGETGHIFRGLEDSAYGRVEFIRPAPEARRRGREERAAYRGKLFDSYFAGGRELELDLSRVILAPTSRRIAADESCLRTGHLLGLNGAAGFTLGLAVLQAKEGGMVRVTTPYAGNLEEIASLAVGPSVLDEEGHSYLIKP